MVVTLGEVISEGLVAYHCFRSWELIAIIIGITVLSYILGCRSQG